MNLSTRNKLFLAIGAVVLVVIALAAALVLPQIGKLGSLESDLAQAEQDAQNARTLLEQRREVRNRAAATDSRLMQLSTAFPENPELTSAIIELQDLAYDYEVEIRSITPQQLTPRGSHVAVPIELTYWGNWRECVDFAQQLMTLNRQYRVVEMNSRVMQAGEAPDTEVDLEEYSVFVSVKLEAYVIPAASATTETAPAAPAPAPAP